MVAHLAVFVGAAVPWFELFAIAPGIGFGLAPVTVGLVAFTANSLVTLATIVGWQRLVSWWQRRRGSIPGAAGTGRARRAFDRYGVPGLALQGPVLSGMYFAAILALSLGAPRRTVVVWSLVSNALWTVALVAATVAGLGVLT
nr:small multi-drug export protein [Saccharopolyspora sp. HNM0983]